MFSYKLKYSKIKYLGVCLLFLTVKGPFTLRKSDFSIIRVLVVEPSIKN